MSGRNANALGRFVALAVLVIAGSMLVAAQQPRDAAPVVKFGTATIAGVAVDDQPMPRPLRRAVVTVIGPELGLGRSAISDDEGRFSFRQLPAGRVTLVASKRGYIDGAYGATRAGRPGTPVELRDGQTLPATITLVRAAVLTGRIRDERGNGIAGLRVFALNAGDPTPPNPVRTRNIFEMGALTDDRGIYRLYDLPPGEYIIAATPTERIDGDITRRSATETDALLAQLRQRSSNPTRSAAAAPVEPAASPSVLAPVYFAGSSTLSRATRIKVGPGEVRTGVDFMASAVPITTIEGTVVGDGPLPASLQLSIVPADTLNFFALGGGNPRLTLPPGSDGRFKYDSIAPGHYLIAARANMTAPVNPITGRGAANGLDELAVAMEGRLGGSNKPETMYAVEELEVAGQPTRGLTLRLQRGSRFSGKVVFDDGSPAITDLSTVRVGLRPPVNSTSIVGGTLIGSNFAQVPPVAVASDGTFEIVGLAPGAYTVQVTAPASAGQTWWCRSALAASRDLLDTGVTLTLGEDVAGTTLALTTRHSEVAGTLQSAAGLPAPAYFVIVMPVDQVMWQAGSRRLKMTRPSTEGRFSFGDLPAGDYLLVALTDVEPAEWQTAEFLRTIAGAGVKLSLAQGERKIQDLRIAGR
jgi:hypothetical protein